MFRKVRWRTATRVHLAVLVRLVKSFDELTWDTEKAAVDQTAPSLGICSLIRSRNYLKPSTR